MAMHAVLAAAIANPRFARPYGSDRGEWGFEAGHAGVDGFIKSNGSMLQSEKDWSHKPVGTYGLH
jgi:hypothetical protein